jgi:hypothetical protein
MKTRLLLLLLPVSMLLLNSCEKNVVGRAATGKAVFSVSMPAGAYNKSASADSIKFPWQAMITVEDMYGNTVFEDSLISLFSFGSAFVSEKIQLGTGKYALTGFMVIDPGGSVIYAAPKTGSPLAYLCTNPLPYNFDIVANQVTEVLPDVLIVSDQTPDKFGYASFGLNIVKTLEFWAICILDNPLSMAPTQITTAKLTILDPDGWHYTFALETAVNHLIIRGGRDAYDFLLEKDGYPAQRLKFTSRELLSATKDSPLILKIPWPSPYRVLVLQPGPESGKDAMISNLEPDRNFGSHRYFEATFLSEPVLTVMRSNRSLIYFNRDTLPKSAVIKKVMLRLTYDLPVPFDSSYATDQSPSPGIRWYGGVLQQIVEPWEEGKVTWNTQPKTTELNQVYISPFVRNVNFIEVDITNLFVSSAASVLPDYGMLFRLWPTDQFPGFRFASSDFAEPSMRPMLMIYYEL